MANDRPWRSTGGGGSSSSTPWRSNGYQRGGKPKKKSPGFFGVLGNLGREAADIVTGLPAGGYAIGRAAASDIRRNPWSATSLFLAPVTAAAWEEARGGDSRLVKDIATPIAKDYAYRYGPLARGDFGEFAHRAGERPLSLALDVIPGVGVATKGLTAARVISPAARSIKLRSPGAVAGREGAAVIEKQIIGSELGRRMRVGTDRLLKKLPPEFAVLGETQRYARAIRIRELKDYTRLKLRAAPREVAKRGLSKNEFIAANVFADFPLRADLNRLVSGLREVEGTGATVRLLSSPKILRLYENPTPKMQRYIEEESKLLGSMEDLVPMGPEGLAQRQYLPTLLARGAKFEDDVLTAERPIPEMIEEIRGELAAAGRPEPRYRPQKSVPEKSGLALGTGGVGAQRTGLRQNKGVLQAMGRVAYDIDTLQPAYMRTIKLASYSDRHADLMAAAKAVDTLPEGHIYIKRHLGERIGYTERTGGEFERRLEEAIDADETDLAAGPTRQNELTTTDESEAAIGVDGRRLAVPERFAKAIVGEYQRSGIVARNLFDRPTDVWRAVVLNLRVGWLVNNIVGNTLLYLLKNSGPEGLRSYFSKTLSKDDMLELFPEHVSGTFYGTQTPTKTAVSRVTESRANPTKWLRAADVRYEQSLRRAMASKFVRKHPKVKARVQAMREETRSFGQAAREALDPADIERISMEINDALGDFFSLSGTERNWVRRIVPFYAWYRAITQITLKLPVDTPARTAMLANVGRIGAPLTEDFGLPWLQGSLPLDDLGQILGTKQANPFATLTDIGRGFFAGDWFAARQRESLLNPYVEGIFTALSKEGPYPRTLGRAGEEMVKGLPPYRLLFPEERESYVGDPRMRELLSYLGVPIRRVSPEVRRRG